MPRIPALPRHQHHPCGQLLPQEREFGQGPQVSPGGNHACPSLLAAGALTPEPGAGAGQALGNGISREPSPGSLKLLPEWNSTPFPVNCCKKSPNRLAEQDPSRTRDPHPCTGHRGYVTGTSHVQPPCRAWLLISADPRSQELSRHPVAPSGRSDWRRRRREGVCTLGCWRLLLSLIAA